MDRGKELVLMIIKYACETESIKCDIDIEYDAEWMKANFPEFEG